MNSTTKYYDADRLISAYERDRGEPASEFVIKTSHAIADIVNKAYSDGFKAGKEAAVND